MSQTMEKKPMFINCVTHKNALKKQKELLRKGIKCEISLFNGRIVKIF